MDSPIFWIGLAGVVVVVLGVAFWLIQKDGPGPVPPPPSESAQTESQKPEAQPTQEGVAQGPDVKEPKPGEIAEKPEVEEPEPGPTPGKGPAMVVEAPQPGEGGMEPATAPPAEAIGLGQPETPMRPDERGGREGAAMAPGLPETPEGRPAKPEQSPTTDRPKPEPPPEVTPADKRAWFASLERVSVRTDIKGPEKNVRIDPSIASMIQREMLSAFRRMKVTSDENAPTALCLTLAIARQGPYAQYVMLGELKHRVSESQEVTIWEHQHELGRFSPQVNQIRMRTLLKDSVHDFFDQLADDHQAVADR
jgi:hypothetical protein